MLSEPQLEQRPAQHYLAIAAQPTMAEMAEVIPRLFGEMFGWLDQHALTPAGPPLIRYFVTDMEQRLEIEVGIPVASAAAGDARVTPGTLPAGQYLTARNTGPYDGLMHATGEFLDWAKGHGIVWQTSRRSDQQEVWGGRVEYYPTDPQKEPNPEKWETELAFLTAS